MDGDACCGRRIVVVGLRESTEGWEGGLLCEADEGTCYIGSFTATLPSRGCLGGKSGPAGVML